MPTWIFKKRAGAPAGTITIDLQSTPTSPDFTITDAVDSQITTTDASIAYELLREPYLRLDGIETDPYVPQPVVKRVFTSNGELVEVGNDGSATPLLVAYGAQCVYLSRYLSNPAYATTFDAVQAAVNAAQDAGEPLVLDYRGTITLDKAGAQGLKVQWSKPLIVRGPGTDVFRFQLSRNTQRLFDLDPLGGSARTWPLIDLSGFGLDDGLTYTDLAPSTVVSSGVTVPGDGTWTAVTLTGGNASFGASIDRVWLEPGNADATARSRILESRPKSGSSTQIEVRAFSPATFTAGDRISGAFASDHVLLGNRHGGSMTSASAGGSVVVTLGKIRLTDIDVSGVAALQVSGGLNAPTPSLRMGVGIIMAGTGSTLDSYVAKNVTINGGDCGGWIVGNAGTFIDRVIFEDCSHDRGTAPTANYSSLNFMVGGSAWVNRVEFRGQCTGRNSGDVGIEIDNAIHAEVGPSCRFENAFSANYYATNFVPPASSIAGPPTCTLGTALNNSDTSTDGVTFTGLPSNVDGQGYCLIESEVCHYYVKSDGKVRLERGNNGSTVAAHASGVAVTFIEVARQKWIFRGRSRRTIAAGSGFVAYKNSNLPHGCIAFPEGGHRAESNTGIRGEAIYIEGFTPRLDIGDDYKAEIAGNTSQAVSIVEINRPGNTGSAGQFRVPPCRIVVGAARLAASGIASGGNLRFIRLEAGHFDIETDPRLEINNTRAISPGNTVGVFSGNVSSTVRARIGMVVYNSDQADGAFCPVEMAGSTALQRLDLDLDLAQMAFAASTSNSNYSPWRVGDPTAVFVRNIVHPGSIANDYPRRPLGMSNSALTASTTLRAWEDVVFVDTATASGTVTLTLPLLAGGSSATTRRPGTGTRITVLDAANNAGTRNIVLQANAVDKMSGVTGGSLTINTNGGKVTLVGHATLGWWPV